MDSVQGITVKVSPNYKLRPVGLEGKSYFGFALSDEEFDKPEDERNWNVNISFEDATIESIEYIDSDKQIVKKEELNAESIEVPRELSDGTYIKAVNITIEHDGIMYTAYIFRTGR